jgi:hypothetical protein
MAANIAARKRLIVAHQEEHDRYLKEERVARGLPAERTKGISVAKLQERKAKLEKQLQEVNAILNGES